MRVICPVSEALGILICERRGEPRFAESLFLRRLMLAGSRSGLPVFAFAPWTWQADDNTVLGWTWHGDSRRWACSRRPLPALVYDRSWPASPEDRERYRSALRNLEARRPLQLLNGKLPGKAGVHFLLRQDPAFRDLLPPTEIYTGPASLLAWLDRHGGTAFLKPSYGSQGRRVAACRRVEDGSVRLSGRRHDNRPFEAGFANGGEAAEALGRWIGSRTYLMQPLLDLSGPGGEPFDVRALVQKNGTGRWTLTGTAVRSGRSGTITANLHGGGLAAPAREKLSSFFGPGRADALLREIRGHCLALVRRLEHHYGRFAELGLDFGVDRSGRLWFLEANSKPGRASMAAIGAAAETAAAARPIAYARSILLRPPGRVIHEFDHL